MVNPPFQNPSFPKTFPLGRFKPYKVYQRRPPLKSPADKNLFHNTLTLVPMAHLWETNLYKPINMANIQGYPNTMPKEVNKWLPKFPRNNVIIVEDHFYVMGWYMENAGI
jgi:hypothetical protein